MLVQKVIDSGGQTPVLAVTREIEGMSLRSAIDTAIECKRLGYLTVSFDFIATVTEKGREFCKS